MDIQKNTVATKSVVFKIKGQVLVLLWVCALTLLFGFILIDMIRTGRETFEGGLAIVLLLMFFWVMGFMLMVGRSDVIIDDQGISRCFLGKTWRTIRWDNIMRITKFPVSDGFGKIVKGYNIFPKVKPRFSFNPSGKMTFGEYMDDIPKLIEMLNFYVLKYDIKVEVRETPYGEFISAEHF